MSVEHTGNFQEFLNALAERTQKGGPVGREDILRLLEPLPDSPEAELLGHAAREMARVVAKNQGKIWCSIGVDFAPCSMNCGFCSFGEKWGLITESHERGEAELIATTKDFVDQGATWITLRTTEFYSLERLASLAAKIRKEVPGGYGVVINTGELTAEQARLLADAGVDVAYHTLRLGEGTATAFDPATRKASLAVLRDSPLKLAHLIEPIGPEHSNEEIADVVLTALEYRAALGGAMARVNVRGTPFESAPPVSDARLAQIVAVTRLCGGSSMPDICVHPPVKKAVEWGANLVVVETGAIPRDEAECAGNWRGFGMAEAKELFRSCGYDL